MNIDKENELRDQFAAAALQGILVGIDDPKYKDCADMAYRMADAMLEERVNWVTSDSEFDDILDNV